MKESFVLRKQMVVQQVRIEQRIGKWEKTLPYKNEHKIGPRSGAYLLRHLLNQTKFKVDVK